VENGLISGEWLIEQLNVQKFPHHFNPIWAILMLEIWCKLYIYSPIQLYPSPCSLKELLTEC
jgi:hypothetical protein